MGEQDHPRLPKFTDSDLVAIGFMASERAWRADLASCSSSVPRPERFAFAGERTRMLDIARKADAMRVALNRAARGDMTSE